MSPQPDGEGKLCVCVFVRKVSKGASLSPPNPVAWQQPCCVAAETEVMMSPEIRENTFTKHADTHPLNHTHTHTHIIIP